MWDRPDFLRLPERSGKPRSSGITHVLDKGSSPAVVDGLLTAAADLVDVVKIGWGIGYLDRALKQRVAAYQRSGVLVCLGGTLVEIAAAQGELLALRRWAAAEGIDALEVSNGLAWLGPGSQRALVAELATDFTVLAEAGAKDAAAPVAGAEWAEEMNADLAAGAAWVIAEGRESGTVGIYDADGAVRAALVEELAGAVPVERVIFEAPVKAQQAWFVRRFGPEVNLGNIAPDDVLPLETLRLGLRADTAVRP
ncbi:phosphosulfolactate synthase [Actinomycetospora sp. TBRC 11914]|uniref:phosphosulfolactate synthase n=1 Tax=Actinomycetospora sp. TBRC 11914 TaxID=2729387 RepID=UPI00145DAC31|nr:phosphosulfolactate synthase [Actinomycetospora sp. TBRC 11914]NMO92088.1 phosphohydrolase [Actinomycetospora sp. TBRC 11914]